MSVGVRGPKNSICGDGELCSWSEDGDVMRISYNVFVVRVVGVICLCTELFVGDGVIVRWECVVCGYFRGGLG